MKGILSDAINELHVSFDFELSETPKAMILRLLDTQSKEIMVGFCLGEPSYNEVKAGGDFDEQDSSFAFRTDKDVIPLACDQSLQTQVGEQIENLLANDKEVQFATIITW